MGRDVGRFTGFAVIEFRHLFIPARRPPSASTIDSRFRDRQYYAGCQQPGFVGW